MWGGLRGRKEGAIWEGLCGREEGGLSGVGGGGDVWRQGGLHEGLHTRSGRQER